MRKLFFTKCMITLGLLLFFTFFIMDKASTTALAGSPDNIQKEEKVSDYRLNLKSITLVKGKSFALKVYNLGENAKVFFKSADPEIASVSDDGNFTANKVGFTTITATIKDGLNPTSLTCDIIVGPPAFSVKMTRSRIILGLDNTDQLRVILKPSNTAEAARFSSYDSTIASVSTGGRISAKKIGFTYLFAEIDAVNLDGSKRFAACSVIVTSPEDAPLLETYFTDHPELNMISEYELNYALEKFFNQPENGAPTVTPKAEATTKSLTESLHQYLNDKFDLAAKRKIWEEAIVKFSTNHTEVISETK